MDQDHPLEMGLNLCNGQSCVSKVHTLGYKPGRTLGCDHLWKEVLYRGDYIKMGH